MKNKTYTYLDIVSKGAQIATSVSLLIIAIVTLRINSATFLYNFRPYLALETGSESKELLPETKFNFRIVNKGSVPANNVRIFYDFNSPGIVATNGSRTQPAIIFPEQSTLVPSNINSTQEVIQQIKDKKLEFRLHATVIYDGIGTKNHITEYNFLYNPEDQRWDIVSGKAT